MKLTFFKKFVHDIVFPYVYVFWTYRRRPMEIWCVANNIDNFFLYVLKKNSFLKARILNDICVVDWLVYKSRFEFIYNIFSFSYGVRFFMKKVIKEDEFMMSCVEVFRSACWLEREVWDLFGIFFFKNPDLRRILTDYGFEGYPLRKDFPLTGYLQIRYDEENGCLVYEPVKLAQEYRHFDFMSPWEDWGFWNVS